MKIKPMFSVLLPPLLALLLTDCAAQAASDDEKLASDAMGDYQSGRIPAGYQNCPGTARKIKGSSVVEVIYGDSLLNVTPHAKVKKKDVDAAKEVGAGAIEFQLKPDKENRGGSESTFYRTAVVTIIGKSGPPGADVSWLAALGRGETSLVVCPDEDTIPGKYKYEVRVQGVGILDPRADVED